MPILVIDLGIITFFIYFFESISIVYLSISSKDFNFLFNTSLADFLKFISLLDSSLIFFTILSKS
jgi:hypothetical protein